MNVIPGHGRAPAAFDISIETRYCVQMHISVPISPHFEEFLREQLASGQFHSESDVIRAALRLLEDQALSKASALGEQSRSADSSGNERGAVPPHRRSPRGILADLPSFISAEDIKENRRAMWTSLDGDGAR
jgi:antitoxin ParD1/3/4